jgi:hypothetical protein
VNEPAAASWSSPARITTEIESGRVIALVPKPRPPESAHPALGKRCYSPKEVADMLGFGIYKVKMLTITGELCSIKDG